MRISPEKRGPEKRAYHHGDLAAEALSVATELVAAEGERSLSMRKIADACGVAHRALYRHYADRDTLLSAVAAEGYRALGAALGAAQNRAAFIAAYAGFALEHAHLYDLMMARPNVAYRTDRRLKSATDSVIAHALAVLAPDEADPDAARRKVMRVWMAMHGGVALYRAGVLKIRTAKDFVGELLAIVG